MAYGDYGQGFTSSGITLGISKKKPFPKLKGSQSAACNKKSPFNNKYLGVTALGGAQWSACTQWNKAETAARSAITAVVSDGASRRGLQGSWHQQFTQWGKAGKSTFARQIGMGVGNQQWMNILQTKPLYWLRQERRKLEEDDSTYPYPAPAHSGSSNPLSSGDALLMLTQVYGQREVAETMANVDRIAQERGFDSAADYHATKDVEREWYSKKYNAVGAPEVEAFKQLEIEEFGDTSFAMAMKGQDARFVGEGGGESLESRKAKMMEELEAEAAVLRQQQQTALQQQIVGEQSAEEQAQQDQQRMMMMAGGAAVLLIGYLMWRD
jgi:hypothetical protein